MRSAPVLAAVGVAAVLVADSSGQKRAGPIDLVGKVGIRIVGGAADDRVGWSVARAGDVNGDRRPDVVIGAPTAGYNGREASGSAFVVFGQRSPATIDLANLGGAGFRIDGAEIGDATGHAVSAAGDVNGDGLADVLVGAPETDNNERPQSGSVYVVYGARSSANVDLAALGNRGYRIDGAAGSELAGRSVADAGDVNGDRRRDLLVGAPFGDNGESVFVEGFGVVEREQSGSLYIVFGQAQRANVDLAALGNRGFRIDGPEPVSRLGWSSARAGDVNRDGKADIVVDAPFVAHNNRNFSGTAYVVFGKASPDTIDTAELRQRGLQIDGDAVGEIIFGGVGWSVAGPGDVNGDGRDDVLIGSTAADASRREDSGSAYVVFGRGPGVIDLATLRNQGFRIDGARQFDYTAGSVAGPGDLNGDGLTDMVISAEQADHNGRDESGSAYVVFGKRTTTGIDLAKLGTRGLRLDGAASDDLTSWSVSGLGDMNGDLLLGAQAATASGREHAGVAYVAFLPDITLPGLKASFRSPQTVLRAGSVLVTASCNEACTLIASGTVAGVALPRVSVQLRSAGRRTLRLTLPPSARARLTVLLGTGKRRSATVTVRAVDAAGNAAARRSVVKVSR